MTAERRKEIEDRLKALAQEHEAAIDADDVAEAERIDREMDEWAAKWNLLVVEGVKV